MNYPSDRDPIDRLRECARILRAQPNESTVWLADVLTAYMVGEGPFEVLLGRRVLIKGRAESVTRLRGLKAKTQLILGLSATIPGKPTRKARVIAGLIGREIKPTGEQEAATFILSNSRKVPRSSRQILRILTGDYSSLRDKV
jgi:hypothetical protein